MKQILFTVIFFLVASALQGQGGFKKKYYLPGNIFSHSLDAIETPDGRFISTGIVVDSFGISKLCLLITDSAGNPLGKMNFGKQSLQYVDNFFHLEGALSTDPGGFYHTVTVRDSNNRYFGALLRFNYNADTIWQKIYRIDTLKDIVPESICRSVDGGLFISGFSQDWDSANQRCILIKTDINGNKLWQKRIVKSSPEVHDGRYLLQDSATKRIIIVGHQYVWQSPGVQVSVSNILLLDSLGNKIFQKYFNNLGGGPFGQVIQLRDKNFLTGGSIEMYDDLGNYSRYRSLVVKLIIPGIGLWL
jgi:hypothetical protein